MINFKRFTEVKDLFGFAEKEKTPPELKPQDENPIKAFGMNEFLDRLARVKIGSHLSHRTFEDQVQWGKTDGALRARLTPNQGISVERLTADLNGQPLWITKKLFKIKTNEFAGHEDVVAKELGEQINHIAHEKLDSPVANYKGLHTLTAKMVERVKHNIHDMFVYQELKKVSENNYNILFSLMGAGVGKIVRRTGNSGGWTPAGIIDLSYNPERGSMKGILSTVSVDNDADPWEIDIPYFMGEFSPSQPMEEVIQAIVAGLKFI